MHRVTRSALAACCPTPTAARMERFRAAMALGERLDGAGVPADVDGCEAALLADRPAGGVDDLLTAITLGRLRGRIERGQRGER